MSEMFSGKGSWYTLVDLSALITLLHNFCHHWRLTVTLWFLLLMSRRFWQWQRCPSSCVPVSRQQPSGAGTASRHHGTQGTEQSFPPWRIVRNWVCCIDRTDTSHGQTSVLVSLLTCFQSLLLLFPKHPVVCLGQWQDGTHEESCIP